MLLCSTKKEEQDDFLFSDTDGAEEKNPRTSNSSRRFVTWT